ncbi:gamma-glutamylcyclotransferase [Dankookia sp. P2]|uniref:gamma-glutamylcyclotransferase n=1 Tax=Dankookia sp. P2 TaxID=3423955 RepID=UPI003D668169
MWERETLPGAVAEPARLGGFARRWSLRDIHNRGVPETPGLTLGLEPAPGGCCEGLLFTLADDAALWPVWRHEMLPGFYRGEWVTVVPLPEGRPVRALTFIADAAHALHTGPLPEAAQARVLAEAVGPRGRMPNTCCRRRKRCGGPGWRTPRSTDWPGWWDGCWPAADWHARCFVLGRSRRGDRRCPAPSRSPPAPSPSPWCRRRPR